MSGPLDTSSKKTPDNAPHAAAAAIPPAGRDFHWSGKFDREKLRAGFIAHLHDVDHYDVRSAENLATLVGFLESDEQVTDLRWMAYLLATAYWETGHIETDSAKKKYWVSMKPVEETNKGAGRPYFLPVKLKKLDSGNVLLTEQDGDQFTVLPSGKYSSVTPGAARGSSANAAPTAAYRAADGDEQAFYGRGYVQLTWWNNYAMAGADIGRGLEFLLDPATVLEPSTAYLIMSFNMRTGKGFANAHKLADYFSGSDRKYEAARAMVNGTDHAAQIADIAERFETVLYEAREGAA